MLFIFTPNPGEMIQFDEHIFQLGWFNHQLDIILFDHVLDVFCQGDRLLCSIENAQDRADVEMVRFAKPSQ